MRHPSPERHRAARRVMAGAAALFAVALATPAALAEGAPNILTDPFHLSLGTFVLNSDTQVRLDGDTDLGTTVDWERTFGDADARRFRLDGMWRFAERHKVRFLWFNYSRSRSRVSDTEIDWGGEIIPINAELSGKFSFDVYELAYEYAFLRRETYELSASVGLHYTDLALRLAASIDSSGNPLEGAVDKEASVGAPLPVVGLRGTWKLPYNLVVDASAQYFALSIDEYDGNLHDYRVSLFWQPKSWLGVGIGYDQFAIDVDVDKSDFKGSLDWSYQGPMIYYSVVF